MLRKFRHRLYFALARVLSLLAQPLSYLLFAGAGSASQLCQHIVASGHRRLLVVTDKQLRDLGLVDRAVSGLKGRDIEIEIFDDIVPDPTFSLVDAGIERLRAHRADAVLAVGGGSSIDAAKVIAAAADPATGDPRDWIGLGKVKHEVLPIYVMPTTSGTGSEATMGAVITEDETHIKRVISGRSLLPAAAAIDSDLLMGMPRAVTAATGMDALTHAIEAYIAIWERGTRTESSRRAIALVFKYLRQAYRGGDNREAREGMAMAAYYAGIAINQVNVGNVHAIAHQLGGRYGIPHGEANALVLPHVLEFCRHEAQGRLAELADLVAAGDPGQSEEQRAIAFIEAVRSLRDDVGIAPTSDLIKPVDFDALTDQALEEGASYFVPRLLDSQSTRSILARISA
jgi:alcohol dehydrogenase